MITFVSHGYYYTLCVRNISPSLQLNFAILFGYLKNVFVWEKSQKICVSSFLLYIFHTNILELDTIMKCVLHSCEILELDFKICLKVCFKSNHKIIKAADYCGFMTSAFSSADPALSHQILFLHRVNGNCF